MDNGTIKIVAALIRDTNGRVLLVRKRGTRSFMQPGGKRDASEDDMTALSREISEELGCILVPASVRSLGEFRAAAANEPGCHVQASLYRAEVSGEVTPSLEIEEAIWIDPAAPPPGILLAPLTRDHVLPLASTGIAGHA